MNLGTFTTLARYAPPNLKHVIFDNGSLLSVGGFPTATSTGSDLAGIARAAGIGDAATVEEPEALRSAVAQVVAGNRLACVVAKVEPIGPKSFHMDISLLENRFQFRRHLTESGDST
jgi:sulfopyruvate decarboxylase subunit beta